MSLQQINNCDVLHQLGSARALEDMYLLGILPFPTESYPCSSGFSMGSLTKAGGEIPKLFHVQHMLLWQEKLEKKHCKSAIIIVQHDICVD